MTLFPNPAKKGFLFEGGNKLWISRKQAILNSSGFFSITSLWKSKKQKVTLSFQNKIVSVISRKGVKTSIIFMFRNTWVTHSDQQKQRQHDGLLQNSERFNEFFLRPRHNATNRGDTSALLLRQGLALIWSLRYVAKIQTSLNSCDRSQRQNSVPGTMIFTYHTRRFVAETCRSDASQQFVASCISALKGRVPNLFTSPSNVVVVLPVKGFD